MAMYLAEETCWEVLLQFRELHLRQDRAGMQRLYDRFSRPQPPVQLMAAKPAPEPPPFPEIPPALGVLEKLLASKAPDAASVCATEEEPERDVATECDTATTCGSVAPSVSSSRSANRGTGGKRAARSRRPAGEQGPTLRLPSPPGRSETTSTTTTRRRRRRKSDHGVGVPERRGSAVEPKAWTYAYLFGES